MQRMIPIVIRNKTCATKKSLISPGVLTETLRQLRVH